MPCYDGGPAPSRNYEFEHRLKAQSDRFEAMLCALTKVLEARGDTFMTDFLFDVDWEEAGVPVTEFKAWWIEHKKADEKRIKAEAEKKRKKQVRRNALKKLTTEEKQLLGIGIGRNRRNDDEDEDE